MRVQSTIVGATTYLCVSNKFPSDIKMKYLVAKCILL